MITYNDIIGLIMLAAAMAGVALFATGLSHPVTKNTVTEYCKIVSKPNPLCERK